MFDGVWTPCVTSSPSSRKLAPWGTGSQWTSTTELAPGFQFYFEQERYGHSGDFLGEDLMRRFRAHLKDPGAAPLDTSDEGPGT